MDSMVQYGFQVFENVNCCVTIRQEREHGSVAIELSPFEVDALIMALKIVKKQVIAGIDGDPRNAEERRVAWTEMHRLAKEKRP